MKIRSILGILMTFMVSSSCASPSGLYYQIYSDEYVHNVMQHELSCVTAIFDHVDSRQSYYYFNGYDNIHQNTTHYRGALRKHYKSDNCYEMDSYLGPSSSSLCMFEVDQNFLVVTNGLMNRTFVLSKTQPSDTFPDIHDPMFVMVNHTLHSYHLRDNLVQTNHHSCFFYPPKDISYVNSHRRRG